jgi:hypothetical protein
VAQYGRTALPRHTRDQAGATARSAGLPPNNDGLMVGFPLAVHPHDGDTIYVIPEESDECRLVPGGALCLYRSKNRGDTWEVLTDGLPQVHAFQNVLWTSMTNDACDSPGVYVGTQGRHILASRDAGDHWTLLFNWLPPVYSLQAAVIDR